MVLTVVMMLMAGIISALPARSQELYIPERRVSSHRPFDVPLMIDKVKNLAGLKIVVRYDPQVLRFTGAAKTGQTASLMHVVNDKQPGRLIIVMAGARGISGEKFPLLVLRFKPVAAVKKKTPVEIKFDHIEMMNENLKPIAARANLKPVMLLP